MGFWAPLRAIGIIAKSPKMLTLIIVPLAVNIVLYVLFFTYGSAFLDGLIADAITRMAQSVPTWLVNISGWFLKILSWLTLALIAALSFTFVSGLLSAPFNDHLSRAAMKSRLAALGTSASSPPLNLSAGESVWLELKRIAIIVVGAGFALVLGLIPFLQLPALAIGAWLVSFEYFGYPISQRSKSLVPVALFTFRHPAVTLGFGSFLLLIMALPFTSIFYIPLAVVGGTALVAEVQETKRK